MIGFKKVLFIYAIILCTAAVSVSGGLWALNSGARDKLPPNTTIGNYDVGGLARQEALGIIEKRYSDYLKNGSLVLYYIDKNEKKQFKIKYSDIDAAFDGNSTIERALGKEGDNFRILIESYFLAKQRPITPEIKFDRTKLTKKLYEFSDIVNRKPQNANIYLIDDKVTKEPEVRGLRLDIENSVKKIEDEITANFDGIIEFKPENNFEITVLEPEFTMDSLKDTNEVISSFTTEIKSSQMYSSVSLAVKAINKVWVAGNGKGEFSFNKQLLSVDGIRAQNNEGYNQVVSTLYAALTKAGVDKSSIMMNSNKTPVNYIQRDLYAVVLGNKIDFRFKNTRDGAIVIFAWIRDNKLTVSLVGKNKH